MCKTAVARVWGLGLDSMFLLQLLLRWLIATKSCSLSQPNSTTTTSPPPPTPSVWRPPQFILALRPDPRSPTGAKYNQISCFRFGIMRLPVRQNASTCAPKSPSTPQCVSLWLCHLWRSLFFLFLFLFSFLVPLATLPRGFWEDISELSMIFSWGILRNRDP